jgi:virginiamycin B lyase
MRIERGRRQGRGRAALLALAAVIACLALAPSAGAAIYWGNGNAIGGAQLDGSLANQAFIPAQGPGGVALDAQHIYWANFGGTTIGRANRDGSGANQSFITTNGPAFGLAVDGGHVYWANNTTGSIGRANLDGSAVNNNFIPGASDPEGVAVDGQHVYWGNGRDANGTVARANLDGNGVNLNFVTNADGATGVALDGTHIFWSSTNHNSIGRVNLDGTTGKNLNFIPDPIALNTEGVAVFGGFIYFTTGNNPGSPGTIGRANLDGSNATTNFITTAAGWPFGVAVDGAALSGPASPTGKDVTKPVLGRLRLSRSVFRAASSGGSTAAKRKRTPVGTKVSFSVSEASSVRFTVQKKAKGRKSGKRCVKPTRKNRKKKKCTRWPSVRGSFTVRAKQGSNSFTFRGRIGGKKLKAGSYRLVGRAADGAKNQSSLRTVTFRIARR